MAGLSVFRSGVWVPVGGGGPAPGPGWQRPADWLTLPELTGSDRQFSALVAVYPHESNYLSFSFSGAYQVDWGDGSAVQTFASNAQADHIYDYDDVAGTECSRGYRQAVVTVTPTTATWTHINLNRINSAIPTAGGSNSILDVVVAGSTLSSVAMRGWDTESRVMEQFRQVGTWAVTDFDSMFYSCASLQSIPALDTSSGTSFSEMFTICASLQSIPLLDTSSGTDFSAMFDSCSSLQSIPALDTSSGTSFSYMFGYCASLQSIPALDTSSGTDFSAMFDSCNSLSDAPLSGTTRAISYSNTRLSQQALLRVFNGLGTAAGAQTITITQTPGLAELGPSDIAIATGKGWTVAT